MKTKERIKTILLCVLLLGAVFLTYSIWFYDKPATGTILWSEEVDYDGESISEVIGESATGTVFPFAISFKNNAGRAGAAYHEGSVGGVFDKTAPILREAISSVSKFAGCDNDEWERALTLNGILFDFEGEATLSAVADLIDTTCEAKEPHGRWLLLLPDVVYMKNSVSGECWRMQHNASGADVLRILETLGGAKCTLAIEEKNLNVSPETLILSEKVSSFTLNGYNPVEQFSEDQMLALLKVFNMNYNTCGKYTEQDGTRVFIEDLVILKVAPDGYITYTSDYNESDTLGGITLSGANDRAQVLDSTDAIVSRLMSLAGGEAKMYLRDIRRDGNAWYAEYGHSFGGIPIDRHISGHSAQFVISSGRVSRLEFYMRRFESAGTIVYPLPPRLAIASVTGGEGAEISLRYTDGGSSGIDAQWYTKIK